MTLFHSLNSDTQNAIKWFAAEFNYLKELKEDIKRIKQETGLSDQEKDYKKVRRAWYYTRRCERRAEINVERVIEDLKKAIQTNTNLLKLEKEMEISSEKLLKAFSFYTGDFQNKLVFLTLKFRTKEKIGKKTQQIELEIKNAAQDIEQYVDTLIDWVSGLEASLKKVLVNINEIKTGEISSADQCQKRDFFIGGIAGTVYVKDFSKIPPSGILVVPGFHASRKQYDFLCKSLAYSGALAYVIDLPSHGESSGQFNVALMSEYILHSIKILRSHFGVREVGIFGHSTGGVAAMFALASYNREVEAKIYSLMDGFYKISSKIEENQDDKESVAKLSESLKYYFIEIKQTILSAIKKGTLDSGKINVVVCIALPQKYQSLFPPFLANAFSIMPPSLVKFVIDLTQNMPMERESKRTDHEDISKFERNKRFKGIELIYLKIPEIRPFLKYMASIKNPSDYMNLLNFFAVESDFIRHYRDKYILGVDKWFLYGTEDYVLGLGSDWKRRSVTALKKMVGLFTKETLQNPIEELESVYSMLNGKVFKYDGLNHIFSAEGERVNNITQALTDVPSLDKVIRIFHTYLQGVTKPKSFIDDRNLIGELRNVFKKR